MDVSAFFHGDPAISEAQDYKAAQVISLDHTKPVPSLIPYALSHVIAEGISSDSDNLDAYSNISLHVMRMLLL